MKNADRPPPSGHAGPTPPDSVPPRTPHAQAARKPRGRRHDPDERRLWDDLRSAWRRHGRTVREPGFWAVSAYAIGQAASRSHALPMRALGSATYGALSLGLRWLSGIELNREARIGRDLHLVHGWNVKVHPQAVIGDRVGLMHDVTIGTTPERPRPPTIGSDVFIGAGARVLGDVVIGDGARIAANSLVVTDVPPGATAIGVPAKVLRYNGRPDGDRRQRDRRMRVELVDVERRLAPADRRRSVPYALRTGPEA